MPTTGHVEIYENRETLTKAGPSPVNPFNSQPAGSAVQGRWIIRLRRPVLSVVPTLFKGIDCWVKVAGCQARLKTNCVAAVSNVVLQRSFR